jgi:hypothetical protein
MEKLRYDTPIFPEHYIRDTCKALAYEGVMKRRQLSLSSTHHTVGNVLWGGGVDAHSPYATV